MSINEPLFCKKSLRDQIRSFEISIKNEVDQWGQNRVLSISENDLVSYLVEKYSLDAPKILRDEIAIESQREVKIEVGRNIEYGYFSGNGAHYVDGICIDISVPFEGNGRLFEFQASTYGFNPPRGQVLNSQILISFQYTRMDPQKTKSDIDSEIQKIEEHLNWTRKDCQDWNSKVENFAAEIVRQRKQRILNQAELVNALDIPIRRRSESEAVSSIPVVRRRKPVKLPPSPNEAFKPEPALPIKEYEHILSVIDLMSQNIERSPSTFMNMKEEQIRDIILVNLNGHYEGDATGETFNAQGKTDILVRADGRNVFIAECKFWSGQKALLDAISQILGYLTWRDTKASLLLFCKQDNFTSILSTITESIPQHPNHKKLCKRTSETHFRYLFSQKNDVSREIHLAVQAFNIPRKKK